VSYSGRQHKTSDRKLIQLVVFFGFIFSRMRHHGPRLPKAREENCRHGSPRLWLIYSDEISKENQYLWEQASYEFFPSVDPYPYIALARLTSVFFEGYTYSFGFICFEFNPCALKFRVVQINFYELCVLGHGVWLWTNRLDWMLWRGLL